MDNLISFLRRYRNILLITLSGFIVPILTNLFSSFLEEVFGGEIAQRIQLLAIVIAMAVVLFAIVLWVGKDRRQWVLVPREEQPPCMPGLIALVGTGRSDRDPMDSPVGAAIAYHSAGGLQCCWLLASRESMPVAEALRKQHETPGLTINIIEIHDPFGIQHTYEAVSNIYANALEAAGMTSEQIISDFTDGTRPMVAGMVLACRENYPMQYMSRKPGAISTPRHIHFQPQG